MALRRWLIIRREFESSLRLKPITRSGVYAIHNLSGAGKPLSHKKEIMNTKSVVTLITILLLASELKLRWWPALLNSECGGRLGIHSHRRDPVAHGRDSGGGRRQRQCG